MPRRLSGWCVVLGVMLSVSLRHAAFAQMPPDPEKLLEQADRLAWLRVWTNAAPLYAEAERLFRERGDERNALYAEVSHLRGQLPRLPVPEVSARLAEYLERPLVQADDWLRLRCLIIKGEVDEDFDPSLAELSWREAQALAEKLGDAAWVNRAKGELGLVSFLQGDVGASVIGLGQALKVAQSRGDVSSLVRWFTLFGHGYVQLGRPQEALDFYDRALKIASTVTELQFPVMTYVGKIGALVKAKRFEEADRLIEQALDVAERQAARGYQAQLTFQLGLIAQQRQQPERALALLTRAADLAREAGGNRLVAEIALDTAHLQRASKRVADAEATLQGGIDIARAMQERLLLPRLLASLADLRATQQRYAEADRLLEEATDLLEGLLTTASSPWVRSRIVSGMDDVLIARIRLDGQRGQNVSRMFSTVERARNRSLLELLLNKPVSGLRRPHELRASERQIATLQRKLFDTSDRAARQRLLDQIFAAEAQMAPISTELFDRTQRRSPRTPLTLRDLQRTLAPDELFLEFAIAEPTSFIILATRNTSRLQRLPGRGAIRAELERVLRQVRAGEDVTAADTQILAATLVGAVPELASARRLVIGPDAELHQLPFELLAPLGRHRLLETHVIAYVPSGSVLTLLRRDRSERPAITARVGRQRLALGKAFVRSRRPGRRSRHLRLGPVSTPAAAVGRR